MGVSERQGERQRQGKREEKTKEKSEGKVERGLGTKDETLYPNPDN